MNIPTKPFRLLLHTLTLSWVLLLALATSTYADSATWSVDPTNDNWNSVKNWTPNTIPNSITDVATFDFSNTTNVSVNNKTTVQSIVFSAGASAYTIAANSTQAFTMSGGGITNASGLPQTLVVNGGADLEFTDAATVDKDTTITVTGSTPLSDTAGYLIFHDTSSAAEGAVVLEPGSHYLSSVNFYDSSSAGNSLIIAQGGNAGVGDTRYGGTVLFRGDSTADHCQIIFEGGTAPTAYGSGASLYENADLASATITANGGTVSGALGAVVELSNGRTGTSTLIANGGSGGGAGGQFRLDAMVSGTSPRVELFGNGNLTLYRSGTIGSVEGDGQVFLGSNTLVIGSNGLSTTFSGVVQDGGTGGGTGGTITKIGTGTLILTNANTYTGRTTVDGGTLLVANTTGSGLGTGRVVALSGILGGNGTISGRVTMGTGSGTGVTLAPGVNSLIPGRLTIGNQLVFKSDAFYQVTLNSETPAADQVSANGVRIVGAQIVFNEVGNAALPLGTVFTVMRSTSSRPIVGTFANLPDGGTVTVGNNTYQANYEGGDGNDLTLTVVP